MPVASHHDVIVLGLGAMGSAACCELARRGARVLGIERFSIPHAMGSSHGDSRMIRLCYFEHPDYVPLLHRAYALWERLERDSGRRLLHITGGLYMGPSDGLCLTGSLRAAAAHDLPHERLDRTAIAERYPQFELPGHYEAVYEPRAGLLLPELVISTHAELALARGAELHGHETVRSWDEDGDGVAVETDRGRYRAGRLVICGGAWSGALLRSLGLELTVTRQIAGWVWPRHPEPFALGTLPVWAIDHPDGSLHYGFPLLPGRPGFKLAHHRPGAPADPDTIDRTARAEEEREFRGILKRHIPGADGPLLSLGVCMYTNSPDGHFIIDRHPESPRVAFACGFSGHGFKFATVVGEIMADLVLDDGTEHPVGFLGLQRFASSEL